MAVSILCHFSRRALLGGLCGLALVPAQMASSLAARSQVADVVHPDPQGDFPSVMVASPRGQYRQRFLWRGLSSRPSTGDLLPVVQVDGDQVEWNQVSPFSKRFL